MKCKLLVFSLLVSFYCFSQDHKKSNDSTQNPENLETKKKRVNEVGLETLGLIDGRFVFSYERSFKKHWSAKLGVGFKNEDGLINLSGIDREKLKTDDVTYSGLLLLGEGRYYLEEIKNGRATGFYFGLYAKYSGFQSDFSGTYTNSNQENFNFLFDAKIGVTSFGFMVGYKLPISNRLAIDFLIAGPGTANYNFDFENKTGPLPEEFFDDLNTALEDLGVLELIEADFDFRVGDSKSVFNTVNFRYAISLTYNF